MFKLPSLAMALFLSQAALATQDTQYPKDVISNFKGVYDLVIEDDYSSQYICPASLIIQEECNGFAIYTSNNTAEYYCNIKSAGKNISTASEVIDDVLVNPPLPDNNPPLPDNNPPLPDKGPKRPGILSLISPYSKKESKVVIMNAKMDIKKSVSIKGDILTRDVKQNSITKHCSYLKR